MFDDEDALRLTHQFDEDFGNWRKNFQKLKESSSSSSHNIGGLLEVGGGGVGGSSFGFSWPFSNDRDEPNSRQPAEFPFGALDGSEDEQPGLRVVGLDRDRESLGELNVLFQNQLRITIIYTVNREEIKRISIYLRRIIQKVFASRFIFLKMIKTWGRPHNVHVNCCSL